MDQKELNELLKKMLLLICISFLLFIVLINGIKLTSYIIRINETIVNALDEDEVELTKIDNSFNKTNDLSYLNYDQNKAHSAAELNYSDDLKSLHNSEWGDGVNILVVGSDKKNFHVHKSRADVIIVIRISQNGKILSISIPRDTLITVYDRNNNPHDDKIGHSMYWNGLDGLKKSVETFIGSPIYKVVIIDNFNSFEAFLSIIGGITIDKQLSGKLGVQWIRNRSFKFGDIDRCKRQQIFLKKAVSKLWDITGKGNVFISSILFDNLRKVIQTDLNSDDFIKLLYILKINNFTPEKHFFTTVLPGSFGTFDSALLNRKNLSCWRTDDNMSEILTLLFYSDRKNSNFISSINVGYFDFFKYDFKKYLENIKMKSNLFVNK